MQCGRVPGAWRERSSIAPWRNRFNGSHNLRHDRLFSREDAATLAILAIVPNVWVSRWAWIVTRKVLHGMSSWSTTGPDSNA